MWQPPITMKTAVTIAALAVATIVASPPTNRSASPELVQHVGSESLQTFCWYDPDLPRCE
jgi:hypothetical protein